MKKEIDAAGNEVSYAYDGNGNMVGKTDADGYVTGYVYGLTDLVETINYQGGKTVNFQYDKNGELIKMVDQTGTTNFALDALGRITSVNDHNNKLVSYTYDSVGNRVSIKYPDNMAVTYEYDLLDRLVQVTEPNDTNTGKVNTTYTYDAAGRLLLQEYPNGCKRENEYDAAGRLLKAYEHDPTITPSKALRFEYSYDAQGNLLTNFRKGVGEGRVNEDYTYSYDALNRLKTVTSPQGNLQHAYFYDSLGNLTLEQSGNNKSVDYKHNILNQMVAKTVDSHDNYSYLYDARGNRVMGTFHKNANHDEIEEQYVYDSANRMVLGTNDIGETSAYVYNGLGDLVQNVWTVKQNAYGYTGITVPQIELSFGVDLSVITEVPVPGNKNKKDKLSPAQVQNGGGNINKTTVITKDYVIDYASALRDVIMETEAGGFTYRYAYGLERLSVTISPVNNGGGSLAQNKRVKLYYHTDRLGSVDYLSDNVSGKVASYIDYDAWGAPLKKSILKLGARELDLAVNYTGHPYDAVLRAYYAKTRMYDANDRRFMAADPVKGYITDPQSMVQYTYCLDNPVKYVDPLGLVLVLRGNTGAIERDLEQLTGYTINVHPTTNEASLGHPIPPYSYPNSYELVKRIINNPEKVTTIRSDYTLLDNAYETSVGGLPGFIDSDFYYSNDGYGNPREGSNAIVVYNPNINIPVGVWGGLYNGQPVAVYDAKETPAYIALAHELIHADRNMHGVGIRWGEGDVFYFEKFICGPYPETASLKYVHALVSWEDIAVIGLPIIDEKKKREAKFIYKIPEDYTMYDDTYYRSITENDIRAEHGFKLRVAYHSRSIN